MMNRLSGMVSKRISLWRTRRAIRHLGPRLLADIGLPEDAVDREFAPLSIDIVPPDDRIYGPNWR